MNLKKIRQATKKNCKRERGQALLIVLAVLMVGSLMIPPLMAHIGTTIKAGTVYQKKAQEKLAADAGLNDAIWEVKYDRLSAILRNPDYDEYDYTTQWQYTMGESVNGIAPQITVQNAWIPRNVTPLSSSQGRSIIENNKLLVSGSSPDQNSYQIKVTFYPGSGENDDLCINTLGVWLPLGYTYVAHSSNLEADIHAVYYSVPVVSAYDGGQSVVWSFNHVPFYHFPGVGLNDVPMVCNITFGIVSTETQTPAAISWTTTQGVSDVPMSWDIDTRVYHITSTAGGTQVDAYFDKCEIRKMGGAIAGDYVAAGNSLMLDTDHDIHGVRDQLLSSSSSSITTIPQDATVVASYLYWSGWFAQPVVTTFLSDGCTDFSNWDRSSNGGSDTRVPTGDGDISGTWNANPAPCWDAVNETTPNDSDYMTGTTSAGGYMLFTFSPFAVSTNYPITDLKVYVRAKDVSSGNNDIRPSIKVGGTRYNTTASSNNPGNSYTTYSYTYSVNPATGQAWTVADINGTGANPLQQFGVYSNDLSPNVSVSMVYAQVDYASDSRWSISSNQFQGQGSSSATTA
ncbi:MAG TPA: hypothetical protein VEI27_02235, partial [Dehalococcoidales bacterium]|nr:hypothetical protein [Dehalococcoidales bacterium]